MDHSNPIPRPFDRPGDPLHLPKRASRRHGETKVTGQLFSGSDVSSLVHPDEIHLVRRLLDIAKERPDFAAQMRLLARNGEQWELHRFEVVHEVMGPILRFQPDHGELGSPPLNDPGADRPIERRSVVARTQESIDGSDAPGVAVILVDVDRMKLHNDRLGGDGGDRLLQSLDERIRTAAGRNQCFATGGDEFVVLVPAHHPSRVEAFAERLREAVTAPLEVCDQAVVATCTIGWACSEPGIDADELLRRADTALLAGKEQGRNRVVRYTTRLATRVGEQVSAVTQLHDSLAQETLGLHYQPIYSIKTGAVVGLEALVRIDRPNEQQPPVKAQRLIEAAEDIGLVAELNHHLLERLTSHLRSWEPYLGKTSDFHVSLNVSSAQILDHRFASMLAGAIDRAGISSDRICLELTETVMLGHDAATARALADLTTMGVALGIDGLGSAGSSFADVSRLQVSFVKLRPSLVASLDHDQAAEAIIEAVIHTAHHLGASTVAVGVERQTQHDLLARLGCDAVQGQLLHGPVPAAKITTLLQRAPSPHRPVGSKPDTTTGEHEHPTDPG